MTPLDKPCGVSRRRRWKPGTTTGGRRLLADQQGATSLEWALLLAAIVVPGFYLVTRGLDLLIGHYQMMTTLNAMPFP